MGHFFVYNRSAAEVMGVNHGGTLLVARRDKVDPAIRLIKESIRRAGSPVQGCKFSQFASEFMYPFGYISSFEGATKYKEVYEFEKRTYAIFKDEFYESFVNFRATEVKKKIDSDLIDAILAIFLHDSSKLTYEFQLSGKVLRVAEKPSAASRLFFNTKSGDTLYSCMVSEISEIEVSEKQTRFFKGDYEDESNNFMTLTRDRCYCQ